MALASSHGETASKRDGKRNVMEAPCTPGRPVFSFSVASRKNSVPSKWNDAEKWLVSGRDSSTSIQQQHHLHGFVKHADFVSSPKHISVFDEHQHQHQHNNSSDSCVVLQEEKMVEPPSILKFECVMSENSSFILKEAESISSRDIGTDMKPLGTSTCLTPLKALSPPRHNTPAATRSGSGPLDLLDPLDIQECHLAKLNLNWTSREEEEEDISKSLRHNFENNEYCRISCVSNSDVGLCREQHNTNYCLRYQREETKIQAWVDLQNAKAEAQSRKLEVKIQKMRSKFEEKLMRKMTIVDKKAEELRAAAQLEHIRQLNEEAKKTKNQRIINIMHHKGSCACFPYNNNNLCP